MEEEDKNQLKLKPNGELKVVRIPFSVKDHYAFDLRPGNSVWGKSWRHKPFEPGKPSEPSVPKEKEKENMEEKKEEHKMTVMEQFTKNTSHVIIGLGLLILIIMFARRTTVVS